MGFTFIPNSVKLNGAGGGQKLFGGTEDLDKLTLLANQTEQTSSCIEISETGSLIDPCITLKGLVAPASASSGQMYLYFDSADNRLKVKFDNGSIVILATRV